MAPGPRLISPPCFLQKKSAFQRGQKERELSGVILGKRASVHLRKKRLRIFRVLFLAKSSSAGGLVGFRDFRDFRDFRWPQGSFRLQKRVPDDRKLTNVGRHWPIWKPVGIGKRRSNSCTNKDSQTCCIIPCNLLSKARRPSSLKDSGIVMFAKDRQC